MRDEDRKKKKKDEKMSSVSMYDLLGVNYKPTTRENRGNYESLLEAIQEQLGDQPRDVLIGAADEVLAELKNEKVGFLWNSKYLNLSNEFEQNI